MLFLTARSRMEDKQQAYTSGGDDYLVKPFAPSELLLKADSLIRRYRVYKGKRPAPESDALRLDEDRKLALKDGETILLTDKEYEILRFFFQNRGQVIDVRTLYENVWGEKYLSSSNNTVMVHVLNLRKKLESDPANPKLIRTVWGKGYQFG
jgi:DNA-binding response OmpR family regulator